MSHLTTPGSPIGEARHNFIFAQDQGTPDQDVVDEREDDDESMGFTEEHESMYVIEFEKMLKEVLEHEGHLFCRSEIECLLAFNDFTYDQKFLLIRLALRTPGKWHRLDNVKYKDLGSNTLAILQSVCRSMASSPSQKSSSFLSGPVSSSTKFNNVIDLTQEEPLKLEPQEISVPQTVQLDDPSLVKVEGVNPPVAQDIKPISPCGATVAQSGSEEEDDASVDLTWFAEDASYATLPELLGCLKLPELQQFAKDRKLKLSNLKQRNVLVSALLRFSSNQQTLRFASLKHTADNGTKSGKKVGEVGLLSPQEAFRSMVTRRLVDCIRLNPSLLALFRRINLIYLRSTQYSSAMLTPAILSAAKKLAFIPYKHKRTPDIWPSRRSLLQYEAALILESEVDLLLDGRTSAGGTRGKSRTATQTPAPTTRTGKSGSPVKGENKENGEENPEKETKARAIARAVVEVCEREKVWENWVALLVVKDELPQQAKSLERFEEGYVLARVLSKAADAYHTLNDYARELEILESLLSQHRWRRGRRGQWHEQKALTQMKIYRKGHEKRELAYEGVVAAIMDPDVHLIYRPKLLRRLDTLTQQLSKSPPEYDDDDLEEATVITIEGKRVRKILRLDRFGKPINDQGSPKTQGKQISDYLVKKEKTGASVVKKDKEAEKSQSTQEHKGKSIWVGRNEMEVTVETLALEHYQDQGYRGFHCEGRIITMLFALLFWDILFDSVPGAFETPYQCAPLDLVDDTFYFARQDKIEARLKDIEQGKGPEFVNKHDAAHRERNNLCVGVNWERYGRQELLEIVNCFKGKALAAVCRLFCEDYAKRCSGLPDLLLWNTTKRECKFVEVKGPGDVLREHQKVWIDVLYRAKMPVEVCHVREEGVPSAPRGKKRVRAARASESSKAPPAKRRKVSQATPSRSKADVDIESEEEYVTASEAGEGDEDQLNPSQYLETSLQQVLSTVQGTTLSESTVSEETERPTEATPTGPSASPNLSTKVITSKSLSVFVTVNNPRGRPKTSGKKRKPVDEESGDEYVPPKMVQPGSLKRVGTRKRNPPSRYAEAQGN